MTTTSPAPTLDIGSSAHHALSDDGLKDADNLGFLQGQPADVVAAWLARCRLLRRLDRMAEAERAGSAPGRFTRFLDAWNALRWGSLGPVDPDVASDLTTARELWLTPADSALPQLCGHALDTYLHAVAEYSAPGLQLAGLRDHDRMLGRISGSMFQLFPYVPMSRMADIARFGALDHAWNNLRDIAEDARAGSCFFPARELDRFGVRWWDVITGDAIGQPGFRSLMAWWLDGYIPGLAGRAHAFICAEDLHPSLVALRASCMRRYSRVERVLRGLDFDYRAFPSVYATEVKRELMERALGGGVKEIA